MRSAREWRASSWPTSGGSTGRLPTTGCAAPPPWRHLATTLTTIFGISDVLAAKILGHTGDVSRFPSAGRFASYTGTAPIEVSSGEVTRHRLSRGGNRSLNHALHLAARVQIMHPGPGRDHYGRKLAEHKGSSEALRSLKRQLAKVVYRHMVADHAGRLANLP